VSPNRSLPIHRNLDDHSKMTAIDICYDSQLREHSLLPAERARQSAHACACPNPRGAAETMHKICFTIDIVSATNTPNTPSNCFRLPCTTIQQLVSFERYLAATYLGSITTAHNMTEPCFQHDPSCTTIPVIAKVLFFGIGVTGTRFTDAIEAAHTYYLGTGSIQMLL
jgi:hypothetical protein